MNFDLPHWPPTKLPTGPSPTPVPRDFFATLVAEHDDDSNRPVSPVRAVLYIALAIGTIAFVLTALAFAGDDGSGMAGLVLFVTGPLFLVAFLMAAPAALFLVLNEPHSERLNSFHDILNASNGR